MRTAVFDTDGSIVYPEEVSFAFNPMIIRINTYDVVMITVSGDGIQYIDNRTPKDNVVELDFSPYVQALFAEREMITSKEITVAVSNNRDSFQFTTTVIWGAMNIGEVFNASRKVTWFKNFPFTFSMYLPKECTIRTRYDRNKYTTVTLPSGLQHINPSELFNPSYFGVIRMDETMIKSTFEYTFDGTFAPVGDGTIINRLVVDNRTCGVYLRWIDRHGFYQYYLFDKGEEVEDTHNSEHLRSYNWDDGVNYYNNVRRSLCKSVKHTIKICAVFVDKGTYDMLKTICSSPLVDMYVGGKWLPVIVSDQQSVSQNSELRDYELEIKLPDIQVQKI